MAYRYYSPYRPITPGTFPSSKKVVKIHNFDERTPIEKIHCMAWGWIEFETPLMDRETKNYELIAAESEIPRTDLISRQYAIEQAEMAIEEADDEKEKEYLKRFIEFLRVLPYVGEDGNLKWEGYDD